MTDREKLMQERDALREEHEKIGVLLDEIGQGKREYDAELVQKYDDMAEQLDAMDDELDDVEPDEVWVHGPLQEWERE